ncbi:hypothetical protein YDYSY3_01620 [Paenibacillus chitinolyticus]|uniref:SWIM zinc finger family protein n=1 Tax=Paenibacillus chitinolyticus TaxID=79263 RepID=UPI0026E4C16C|nr:SWIM zinc finger family protein [Paenibacillus chitinolyticus]GKS09162.1 hypothetical protein YDYSY3_01620 [Paenibacillus chitinolyticus]
MINLSEAYVDSLAHNSAAMKNGKDLFKKKSFTKLCKTEDGKLLFGECKGSGKEPYRCSVDWMTEGQPVFRCSCPSRQFPCKHLLGLMYAYAAETPFETAPIPEDIMGKREKVEKREQKKSEATSKEKPTKRKTSKSALLKKIGAQLEGIVIFEKLLHQIVQSGLGSLDKQMLKMIEDQAKQLGNYYIPGIQTAMRNLIVLLRSDEEQEMIYAKASAYLSTLHTLLKKSRGYLQQKLDNPEQAPELDSTIEEWIGHAWQLAELRECGRVQSDRDLMQLSFNSYADEARGEYVDESFWADVESGTVYTTRTYRPFRAAKFIKEEDSYFAIVNAKELMIYPGELNCRIRWEGAVPRPVTEQDFQAVKSKALSSVTEAVKIVKNQIKNPLSDKRPVLLLAYDQLMHSSNGPVLLDGQGKELQLSDLESVEQSTAHMLPMLHQDVLGQQAAVVRFEHDMDNNRLHAQLLSIVTDQGIIRLLY